MANATTWQLKKGCDRRVKALHPWVFSNEVASSLKNLQPGAPVELHDINNQFVAYGYGNPNSNICFRALSYDPFKGTIEELIYQKIMWAWKKRHRLGIKNSFRLCFSENDFVSGLVVDYYSVEQNGKTGQVLAVQISGYGIENALRKNLKEFFKRVIETAHKEGLTPYQWSHTCLVLRNDINARKAEGLPVEKPEIIKECDFFDLKSIELRMTTSQDQKYLLMTADLFEGQKTGFFLDQTRNIEMLLNQLKKMHLVKPLQKLKILDLCCYVGHWSAQMAYFCKENGIELEVTLADVSKEALAFAEANVAKQNPAKITVKQMDVFEELPTITETFDIVICDPPALIKSKRAIPTGQHAYMKLNDNALQRVVNGGMMVTCSCSGLLLKEDFLQAITKAGRRAKRNPQIIAEGGHGPDHPHVPSFPEGFYLKMFLLNT